MSATINEQQLHEACRETLRQWPEARAALLFGSRARGTSRKDSDWDVAIVLSGGSPEGARPATRTEDFPHAAPLIELGPVDCWALTETYLRRRASDLGSLPYTVCRDGRLLAGRLKADDKTSIHEGATLNPEDWQTRMSKVLTQLNLATIPIGQVLAAPGWDECLVYCSDLMRISSNAAELLARAVMERRGVAADHTHDTDRLARDFLRARPGEEMLARRLSVLNGKSHQHHLALDDEINVELADVTLAVDRFCGALALWADEINPSHDDRMSGMTGKLASRTNIVRSEWLVRIRAGVVAKPDEDSQVQAAASAVIDRCGQIEQALTGFCNQVQKYVPAPPAAPSEAHAPDQGFMPDPFEPLSPFDD